MGASLEFIESKIVEIFQETDLTVDQAADETLAFLDRMDPKMPSQLESLGEAGILQLFHVRPVLRPATANLARLQEFVRAFLKYAGENKVPTVTPPNGAPSKLN